MSTATQKVSPNPQFSPSQFKVPPTPKPVLPSQEQPAPTSQPEEVAPTPPSEQPAKPATFSVTNPEFIAAVFPHLPAGASPAVCSKSGDPTDGGWHAQPSDGSQLPADNNNYANCSSFHPSNDGTFSVRKAQFAAYHFMLLDDLGTKVQLGRLGDFKLSWLIETSPDNFQGGVIFVDSLSDSAEAERLQHALIAAELCDAGASGISRWARLPNAINGKAKYKDADGNPFQCRLVEWNPDRRYTPEQIISSLNLELNAEKKGNPFATLQRPEQAGDELWTPRPSENRVISALKERGLYKTPLGSGKHDITCPWVHEHTDQLDTGAAYFEPDDVYPFGGFSCLHSHKEKYHIKELLSFLGIANSEARHKPLIRIVPGELHRVVDAAEHELTSLGRYYQAGGLIVTVVTDAVTGDPSIVPIGVSTLTRQLSVAAMWEKFDRRLGGWVRSDPPPRHVSILYDSKSFRYLPALAGVTRQPYFRESDGGLVTDSGYDDGSKMFGVFDPRQFSVPALSEESARSALTLLTELLAEFHFVSDADKAAALSAIFTAVVRPTLPHAPAFHVRAPVFGSGKTYLCELIGTFAGPGQNTKVSYPKSSEEATKAMLSLLLANPAVVEFDDMDADWAPYGTILRMLTAEQITDRILGYSKTATVSTRTLFLGSGNNVGPVRDLLRRVLTIHIDPRTATPSTMKYSSNPVEKVRKNRGKYVAAVLTIIQAWRSAGSPLSECESIVTFGGKWSEYCRQPLMWLGLPDPASGLLEQVKHDPDGEALGRLLSEWYRAFGSSPTTVRKAVDAAGYNDDLKDAIREFPVEERGHINRSKLGWVLKKNANRIINGMEFQRDEADGRTAWRVTCAKVTSQGSPAASETAASPELPPLSRVELENLSLDEEPF